MHQPLPTFVRWYVPCRDAPLSRHEDQWRQDPVFRHPTLAAAATHYRCRGQRQTVRSHHDLIALHFLVSAEANVVAAFFAAVVVPSP